MRELKFRAWNGSKMRYEVSINDGQAVRKGYQWFNKGNDIYESKPMQFTGLLDKNGVEIYDGDIVFDQVKGFDKRKSVIQLDSVNPCFVLKRIDNKYSFNDYEYDFSHCGLMTIEVIGNIHENKELI